MEAEEKSRRIISDAHDEVLKIQKEYESLRKEIYVFKTRFKSLIEAQLSTLEDYYSEIENVKVDEDKEKIEEIEEETKDDEEIKDIDNMGA